MRMRSALFNQSVDQNIGYDFFSFFNFIATAAAAALRVSGVIETFLLNKQTIRPSIKTPSNWVIHHLLN